MLLEKIKKYRKCPALGLLYDQSNALEIILTFKGQSWAFGAAVQ